MSVRLCVVDEIILTEASVSGGIRRRRLLNEHIIRLRGKRESLPSCSAHEPATPMLSGA